MWTAEMEILEVSERLEPMECPEDPGALAGQPLGMYHCPHCMCMVVAGWDAHPHEIYCRLGLWNGEMGAA